MGATIIGEFPPCVTDFSSRNLKRLSKAGGSERMQRKLLILAHTHPCGTWRVEQQLMPISPDLFPLAPYGTKDFICKGQLIKTCTLRTLVEFHVSMEERKED